MSGCILTACECSKSNYKSKVSMHVGKTSLCFIFRGMCVCGCVFICKLEQELLKSHVYMYVCVCACACVCGSV